MSDAGAGEQVIGRDARQQARSRRAANAARPLIGVAQDCPPELERSPASASCPAPAVSATVVGRACGRPNLAEQEFNAFFARNEQPLYGYLRRMLPPDESALEITQEAFFRAWRHFEEIRVYDRPEAWLFRVATNLAISHLRRHRPLSFSHVFRRFGGEGEASESGSEAELLPDALDLEGQTAERDVIDRILLRLPPRQRAALLLRVVYGHSCQEIAQALHISLPNARQTLSRGRERFRTLYTALHAPAGKD